MNHTIGIIGFGKLGATLAEAFNEIGFLHWILDSSLSAQEKAKERIKNITIFKSIKDLEEIPDNIFLTVNDSLIESVSNELAEHFGKQLTGKHIIHCSGVLPLKILNSCKNTGAKISSIHPYQTFYYPSKELLKGIAWSIRTDEAQEELMKLIEMLDGYAQLLPDDESTIALYHSSAVVASNFMNTLLSLATDIAEIANIDSDRFIPPITRTTLENNLQSINKAKTFPLTGPYARADIKTIELHISSLKSQPHLLKQYCYLGLATVEKIKQLNLIEKKVIEKIENLLKKNI